MIATDKEPVTRQRMPRGNQRVVCVDDDPYVRRALYRVLNRESYDVLIAETPRQVLKYVQDFDVDLVIADQLMPDMTGVELLKAIGQVSPLTAGLILTGYPESVLADDPPGIPLVTKPWDDDTLRVTIQTLLEGPSSGAETWAAPLQGLLEGEEVPRRTKAGTVLVPLDGTPRTEAALAAIMPLVRTDAKKIELVRVLQDIGLHPDIRSYMEKASKGLAASGLQATFGVRWGDPAEQILLQARHSKAELIAMTTERKHRPSWSFRGSVTERVLRKSEVPLLVCRPGMTFGQWKRILVPLDGSRESEAILQDAVRLANQMGASLDIVRAATPPSSGSAEFAAYLTPEDPLPYLQEIAKFVEFADVPVEVAALHGHTAWEIVHYAERAGADLICMMTRGRGGLAHFFLGSTAEEVIRSAPCPVYVRRILSS